MQNDCLPFAGRCNICPPGYKLRQSGGDLCIPFAEVVGLELLDYEWLIGYFPFIYAKIVKLMLESRLASFGAVPFSHGALLPLLAEYRRPSDKIAEWLRQGVLIPLKRGLYVAGADWRKEPLSLPLVANRLYGPSCVSLEYALAWHGLIPEQVHEVTSVCVRRGRVMENAVGRFSYYSIPAELFPIGMQLEQHGNSIAFLMAGPEKALCDKVMLTRHLHACSRSSMREFLFEDMRMDHDALATIDLDIVDQYVAAGHKPRQMQALRRVLGELR